MAQSQAASSAVTVPSIPVLVAVLDSTPEADLLFAELLQACRQVGVSDDEVVRIGAEQFNFGPRDVREKLYSARIAFACMTAGSWPTLLYQLAVRDAYGSKEAIVLAQDPNAAKRILYTTSYQVMRYDVQGDRCLAFPPASVDVAAEAEDAGEPLADWLANTLKFLICRSLPHRDETFHGKLRRLCERDPAHPERRKGLLGLEKELSRDMEAVTGHAVHGLALAYREMQDYDAVIRLCREFKDHHRVVGEEGAETPAGEVGRVAILVQLANALTRRNQAGDRALALQIMLEEVVSHQRHAVPDNVGLVGRIYKDMFAESKHTDTEALENAIHWYKTAMEIEEGFYPAINLATLLYVKGERIPESQLLADMHIKLVWFLGRHGDMAELTNFWTVATIFEMHVLFERYDLAVTAAFHMSRLKAPSWYLRSTMGNVRLIQEQRVRDETDQQQIHQLYDFWIKMFTYSTEDHDVFSSVPVLLREPFSSDPDSPKSTANTQVYQPCELHIDMDQMSVGLFNITCCGDTDAPSLDCVGQNLPPQLPTTWTFPSSAIQRISLNDTDDCALYLFANFNLFDLTFASHQQRASFLSRLQSLNVASVAQQSLVSNKAAGVTSFEFDYVESHSGLTRKLLGRGASGCVYSGTDHTTGLKLAIKEIILEKTVNLQTLQEEISMAYNWQCPHIVRYLGSKVAQNDTGQRCFWIFLEQVVGGTLADMVKQFGPPPEQEAAGYTRQILKGLAFLHELPVVHRDVKGDNIMVGVDGLVKLTDLGLSKKLNTLVPRTRTLGKGTARYIAPEVATSQKYERGYGTMADIWSLGCTVVEVLTGRPPYADMGPEQAYYLIGLKCAPPSLPADASDDAKDFLECCFHADPRARSTAKALLSHRWIASASHPAALYSRTMPVGEPTRLHSMSFEGVPRSVSDSGDSLLRGRIMSTGEGTHQDYDTALDDISSLLEKLLFAQADNIVAGWAERLQQISEYRSTNLSVDTLSNLHGEICRIFLLRSPDCKVDDIVASLYLQMDQNLRGDVKFALEEYPDAVLDTLRAKCRDRLRPHWVFGVMPHLKGVCRTLLRACSELARVNEDSGLSSGSLDRLPLVRSRSQEDEPTAKHVRFSQRASSLPSMASFSVSSSASLEGEARARQLDVEGGEYRSRDPRHERSPGSLPHAVGTPVTDPAASDASDWNRSGDTVLPWSATVVEPDPALVEFLLAAGCSNDDVQRFVKEEFTLDVLLSSAGREDVAQVLPRLGPQLKVWHRIQDVRKDAQSGRGPAADGDKRRPTAVGAGTLAAAVAVGVCAGLAVSFLRSGAAR